jgi:hypothetical protein
MKKFIWILLVALVLIFIARTEKLIVPSVEASSMIHITVTNDGAFSNIFELLDNNNGKNGCINALPNITLAPHANTSISLCSSEAQTNPNCCGSFKDRIKGNNTWNNHDLLDDGATVSL